MSNLADESDSDGEPETPFNVDLDTEGLVRYLNAEFGTRVISYVRKNNINGESFLSLTRDDLKSTKLPNSIQNSLLEKVAVLKEDTAKPDDSTFVRTKKRYIYIYIYLYSICIFITR